MFNQFEEENNANVPDIFRGKSKSKVFDILEKDQHLVLGEKTDRANTLDYMYQVYRHEVFRITREELLQFESTLNNEEVTKAPFFNVGYLVERLNQLQIEQGRLPLGYMGQPSEKHFTRVLRFLDRYNCLKAFKSKCRNSQPPHCLAGRM